MYLFARLLSIVSNPGFVTVMAPFLIVYKSTKDVTYALKWELFSFLFISVGVIFMLYGVKKGLFSDLDISKREQRPAFFYFSIIVLLIYLLFLILFQAPENLIIASISILVGIFLMGIVNRFLKASIHTAIVSAFIISLTLWYSAWFATGIILILLVSWSRVKLKRHTVSEVIAGGAIGIVVTLLTYSVVKYII